MEFKKYKRTNLAELRPVTNVEIATGKVEGVSISDVDRENGSPKVGDMIGRNPENHDDKWLISADYAATNFAELDGELAGNIIKFFSKRKGFDHWWYNIDEDIRQEIINDLHEIL